jgi:protein disulfide-isomerase-like protein
MASNSTQCNKIILLLIIVILMYLLLCKNSSAFGGSIARLVGGNGGVKKLTASNYKDTVGNGKVAFIKVYTDWCGYCTRLKPAWDELGKELADDDNIVIAEVDADKEKDLASSLGAKGFPTIVLVKGPHKENYNGDRDTASMKAFVLSKK